MLYKKLSKDENGSFILKEAETISLPKDLFNGSEKVSSANDSFKVALETVTHWNIQDKISEYSRKIDDMSSNDVSSIKSINDLKEQVKVLKSLDGQLSTGKVDSWFIGLACAIERPKSTDFTGSEALVKAIKGASTNADYKSVRDALLDFGKSIIPKEESGIKPKKPSFRLENPHDGRYSIEELVSVCTARKPKITRKGLKYQSPSDSDILYNALTELYYNCYNLPIKGGKKKVPKNKHIAF